jgi:hypothetical protein
MVRKILALAVALSVLLLTGGAAAKPIRFTEPVTCTAGPHSIDLAPGRYMPEREWADLDAEIMRLQDAETRLEAEKAELLKSDPTTWELVLGALVAGAGVGYYLGNK